MNEVTIVMFGATGDLAKKKLWTAWESLVNKNKIAKPNVIGVAYSDRSQAEFRQLLDQASSDDWYQSACYLRGDLDKNQIYNDIATELQGHKSHTIIFVLAVAPKYFNDVAIGIDRFGLLKKCRDQKHQIRIMIEKPFGTNLQSAKTLDHEFCSRYKSDEIYRIDHYLGKSMLQNLYTLRSLNPWFSAGLSNKIVKRIEVVFFETNDASDRGSFYDAVGAWRDVGQNHMLQLLAAGITCDLDKDHINQSRATILNTLVPIEVESWVRGQYQSYSYTDGVADKTDTETYFSIKLQSNHSNWQGVPVHLQSGKSIGIDEVRLSYILRAGPDRENETRLDFYSKPTEQAVIELYGQDDSHGSSMIKHEFKFSYSQPTTDAYERVFLSAIQGEKQWFVSTDEVEAQWQIADMVHELLLKQPLEKYSDNSLLE
jgi:glucose-6-phosphate 1-dehydrogenase